ncbi:MAG: hypothetical protein KIT34_04735 [Cyanobacteria bacterium TGS_CYA1]|nr:hypothetical protein [Cyanobacteria bacterium TGS_CYA1]
MKFKLPTIAASLMLIASAVAFAPKAEAKWTDYLYNSGILPGYNNNYTSAYYPYGNSYSGYNSDVQNRINDLNNQAQSIQTQLAYGGISPRQYAKLQTKLAKIQAEQMALQNNYSVNPGYNQNYNSYYNPYGYGYGSGFLNSGNLNSGVVNALRGMLGI